MTDDGEQEGSHGRVLLVTGVSGAGKTSALKALEDLGYEAVDNVPISMLTRLVSPGDSARPLAVGVDIRARDFDAGAFLTRIDGLTELGEQDLELVFLDCDDDVLGRRFEETRRRHPLALDRPVSDGIAQERILMAPILERATRLIDTTDLAVGDMKRVLDGHFGLDSAPGLSVFVTSFAFRHGLPRDADLVFDVRFLRNPHYEPDLRDLSGRDDAVAAYVSEDEGYAAFFERLCGLLEPLLDRYAAEGKSYLTIAIGCTGGRHRSVFVAGELAGWLEGLGKATQLRHRDLDKSDV